jgi:hypothetical protein
MLIVRDRIVKNKLINEGECRPKTREVFQSIINYLQFLSISYRDLNEVRIAELELNRLRQSGLFPEYLAKFTGYAA